MIAEMILKAAQSAALDRQIRIADAWNAYDGKMTKPLKATKSDPNARDNVTIALCSPIVNTGVSFLLGQSVDFEVDGESEGETDDWLTQCWKQNRQMTLLHLMAINGGVTGDVFVKVMPPDTSKGQKFPRVVNLDPATVTPIWSMDDYEDVLAYVVQWNGIDPMTGKAVVRRQLIESEGNAWAISDQISRGNSGLWETIGVTNHPYAWSPIFHCQNLPCPNVYYGLSDIEQHVIAVNDAINFVLSNMNRIVRIHAHPKTWGKGFQARELDSGVDSITILPNALAELHVLEMQSDLGSSLELYKRFKEVLHEIVAVPEIATGKVDNIGQLSGLAIQILYQSLLQKNGTKQIFYGEMLDNLNMRLLEMGNKGEDHVCSVQWPDPLPKDAGTEAATATTLDNLGVSKDTLLTNLGYDPKAEKDKKAQEQAHAQQMGADMLDQFGKGQLPGQAPAQPGGGNP